MVSQATDSQQAPAAPAAPEAGQPGVPAPGAEEARDWQELRGPLPALAARIRGRRPTKSWETRYAELVAFHAEHGHCKVPFNWPANAKLGRWVNKQREEQFHGRMSLERQARLKALGFLWQGRAHAEVWEGHFQRLLAYQREHGHQRVMEVEDRKLWGWICTQRSFNNQGMLKPARRARLNAIGFSWKGAEVIQSGMVPGPEKRWEMMCVLLEAQVRQEGPGCIGPLCAQTTPLGRWLRAQRRRAHAGLLPAESRSRLAALGVMAELVDLQPEPLWQSRYQMLRAFYQEHGHSDTAAPMKPPLRAWCHHQRVARSMNELKPEHIALLDEVRFEWDGTQIALRQAAIHKQQTWDRHYEKLRLFHQKHGHSDVPHQYQGKTGLYIWTVKQRTAKKKGGLSPEQEGRLAELGFKWALIMPPGSHTWESSYAELKAYHAEHGHTRVLSKENARLSAWRYTQCHERAQGTLDAEKIAKLEALDFDWKPARSRVVSRRPSSTLALPSKEERRWHRHYRKLKAYHGLHGHCRVPIDSPKVAKLGAWVFNQRYKLKSGELSQEKVALLAALGFR